jgi:hypothetical protein
MTWAMPRDDLLENGIDDHKDPLTEHAVESDFSILVVQYAVYQRLQQISIINRFSERRYTINTIF